MSERAPAGAQRFRALLLAGGLLLALSASAGAIAPAEARRHGFHTWQVKDGLPQNQARAVLQARDGYLWVATFDGLARFDGIRFAVFNRANTPAIRSNIFTSLYEDRAGTLWIGSDGGLLQYRDQRFACLTAAQGLASDMIVGIAETPQGALLVATRNQLQVVRDGVVDRQPAFTLPDSASIHRIITTRGGDIWLATSRGAVRLHDGVARWFGRAEGLPTENLNAVLEDADGALWFGTIGQGVVRLRGGKVERFPLQPGRPGNIVYAMLQDAGGQLWIGTHGGLYQYNGNRFLRYNREQGLPSDFVIALCADHEGNVWAGTDGGGIALAHESGVRVFTTRDGLAGDFVHSIAEDGQGRTWVASWFSDGVSVRKGDSFRVLGAGDPLLRGGVRALLTDRRGTLWLGVAGNRLVSYREGRFVDRTGSDNALPPLFALAEGEPGQLWLGCRDGLFRWQEGRLVNLSAEWNRSIPPVRILLRSRTGGFWIGTDYGLLHYENGALRTYTERDGLPYPFIGGLYEDEQGVLWIGTRGGGLCRLKDGALKSITIHEGLPSDTIYQILEDGYGNLWCGSSRAIFRVVRHELNEVADGLRQTLGSVYAGQTEGLRNSVHFGTHPSAYRDREGKLWFPTMNGAVRIDPEKFRFQAGPPPVHIERLLVDKRPYDPAAPIVAPPGRGEVEIQYTGLSFIAAEGVSFRYQLEGFKSEWIDAGTRRTAYYTNLPPGEYVFRVLASRGDGVWSETGAPLRFRLRPQFYQAWWFYLACALAVGGLAWGVHRRRLRQMQARHSAVMAERNRIARDIHDTLAQEVAGLLAQLQVIKTLLPIAPESAGRHLDRAVELARTGLADARRLVLDLRHQALEHDDLATALERFITQMTAETHPPVRYQIKGTPRRLAREAESNLLLIGQESVANALRHAQADSIEVTLQFDPKSVELRIRDNGRGFDPATHSQGFGGHYGLLGIRERAAQISGRLSLSSAPGAGTEIVVRVDTGLL